MIRIVTKRNLNILLLVFISFLIFIVPLFPGEWHKFMYNITFTLVFINSVLAVERFRKFNIPFAVSTIVADILTSIFDLPVLDTASMLLSILFYFYLSAMFIAQISRSKIVDAKIIIESIVGYLMLGVAFGLLIALVMYFSNDAFSFPASSLTGNSEISGVSSYIYASIVTLSTLGYGDILPNTPLARSLVTFITICGQFYMAIIVALLIGKFSASINRKAA